MLMCVHSSMLCVCRRDTGIYSSEVGAQIHFKSTWVAAGDLLGLEPDSAAISPPCGRKSFHCNLNVEHLFYFVNVYALHKIKSMQHVFTVKGF